MKADGVILKTGISKRKLKSYLLAEEIARELRNQMSNNEYDEKKLFPMVEKWMKTTGDIKYKRP